MISWIARSMLAGAGGFQRGNAVLNRVKNSCRILFISREHRIGEGGPTSTTSGWSAFLLFSRKESKILSLSGERLYFLFRKLLVVPVGSCEGPPPVDELASAMSKGKWASESMHKARLLVMRPEVKMIRRESACIVGIENRMERLTSFFEMKKKVNKWAIRRIKSGKCSSNMNRKSEIRNKIQCTISAIMILFKRLKKFILYFFLRLRILRKIRN